MQPRHRTPMLTVAVVLVGTALLLATLPWAKFDEPRPTALVSPTPGEASRDGDAAEGRVSVADAASTERTMAPPPPAAESPAPVASPEPAAADHVQGRVRLDTLEPAPGATVRIGREATKTDAEGRFAFARARVRAGDLLVATLGGYEPVRIDDVAQSPEFQRGLVLEIVLPGKALAIDGWLVDERGAPCRDWKLELWRGTDCGPISFPNLFAEDLAAGGEVPGERERAKGERASNPNLQRIGADGAFKIGGLRRGHDYVLRAWNQHTLLTAISEPIAAGVQGYRFVVPAPDLRDRVNGRIVDRHGAPLAGARVRLSMREHQSGGGTSYQTGQAIDATGPDGFFEFRQVPRQDLLIRCDGKELSGVAHELRAADPGTDLRIVLGVLCRCRFEARSAALATATLRMLDADEKPLPMTWEVSGPGHTRTGTAYTLQDGRSPDLEVSDAAAWLSVRIGDREMVRATVSLVRGTTTVLRD